jgi:hypothetical protein
MHYVNEMIMSHPQKIISTALGEALISCIKSCFNCAQACVTCSDACLGEKHTESLRSTIRATADCVDVCLSTGKVLSRLIDPDFNVIKSQVSSCISAVHQCGILCYEHRHEHKHCEICADACRICETACADYLKRVG